MDIQHWCSTSNWFVVWRAKYFNVAMHICAQALSAFHFKTTKQSSETALLLEHCTCLQILQLADWDSQYLQVKLVVTNHTSDIYDINNLLCIRKEITPGFSVAVKSCGPSSWMQVLWLYSILFLNIASRQDEQIWVKLWIHIYRVSDVFWCRSDQAWWCMITVAQLIILDITRSVDMIIDDLPQLFSCSRRYR